MGNRMYTSRAQSNQVKRNILRITESSLLESSAQEFGKDIRPITNVCEHDPSCLVGPAWR